MNFLTRVLALILLYFLLFARSTTAENTDARSKEDTDKVCPEFHAIGKNWEKFTWTDFNQSEDANLHIVSMPPCLNENMQLVTKQCLKNGTWYPSPHETSCYKEQTQLNRCPQNMMYIVEINKCIFIENEYKGPPSCPYPGGDRDYNFFIEIANLLQSKVNISKVWLHAKRNLTNGIGNYEYTHNIESKLSFNNTQGKISDNAQIKETECVVYNINENSYDLVSCNSTHSLLCIYQHWYFHEQNAEKNYFTIDNRNKYFYLKTTFNKSINLQRSACPKLASPVQANRMYLLKDMLQLEPDEECWFGLENNNHEMKMGSIPFSEIEYANWDHTTNYNNRYGVFDKRGVWNLKDENSFITCVACEVEIPKDTYTFELKYANGSSEHMLLSYTNGNHKLATQPSCFTNSENSLVSQVSTEDDGELNFTKHYKVNVSVHPGLYWCFIYPDSNYPTEKITSNTLKYIGDNLDGDSTTYDYVLYGTVKINKTMEPTDTKLLEMYSHQVKRFIPSTQLHNSILREQIRVMQIQDIRMTNSSWLRDMDLIFHLTVSLKDSEQDVYDLLSQTFSTSPKDIQFLQLLGSDHCFASKTDSPGSKTLHWPQTRLGHTKTLPDEICWNENNTLIIVSRKCIGSFVLGASWNEPNGTCYEKQTSETTISLWQILNSQSSLEGSPSKVAQAANVTHDPKTVDADGVKIISELLKNAVEDLGTNAAETLELVSNVADFSTSTLKIAQSDNATDRILYALDCILLRSKENSDFESPNVVAKVIDLNALSSSYITLTENSNGSVASLGLTQETDNAENVSVAIFIPGVVLEHGKNMSLKTDSPETMVASVFFKDSLFTETGNNRKQQVVSSVVSLAMHGMHQLRKPIEIKFKGSNTTNFTCGFWNYSQDHRGFWQRESDVSIENHGDESWLVCYFNHLTHFALLVSDRVYEPHTDVLDFITISGCTISALSIFAIFVTAIKFASWRDDTGHRILLQFSSVVLMKYILLFISSADLLRQEQFTIGNFNLNSCKIVASLLHYVVMAEFCWMLVIAVLQYRRFVVIIDTKIYDVYLTASLFSWVVPLIPVIIVLLGNSDNESKTYNTQICFLTGFYLYLLVLTPIAIVIFVNTIILILIIKNIRKSQIRMKFNTHSHHNMTVAIIRLGIFLFFLLGLTWIFGLLVAISGHLIFVYLFCITGTLQGFVMFLYFVAWNEKTQKLWYSFVINVTESVINPITKICCLQGSYDVYKAVISEETETTLTEGNSRFYTKNSNDLDML